MEGLWQHSEIVDGTYTLEDLLDAHELLDVKGENKRRIDAWCDAQRRRER